MENKEDLERDLNIAIKILAQTQGRAAPGAERAYGIAYQNLVRAGYRPQIRAKYRG